MMRILVVEAAGLLWGSERSLLNVLACLPKGSVAVCCPQGVPLVTELERLDVRSITCLPPMLHKGSRSRRLIAAAGILRACFAFQPDVIYLNQAGLYRTARPAAKLWNIPVVAHFRLFEEVHYLAQLSERVRVQALIASSRSVEADVRSRPTLTHVSLHQLYDPFLPAENCGASDRPRRIVCAGRVEPAKGQELLIDALFELETTLGPIECWFAGEGNPAYMRHLQQKASYLKNTDVKWLGFVANVPELLRSSQVLAFPSERETLGRVVLEAWDAGAIPVVFAGSGGAAEIVISAGAGVVYDSQTSQSLAAALKTALLVDQQHRATIGVMGRAWTAANCRPDDFATALDAVFAEAVAGFSAGGKAA